MSAIKKIKFIVKLSLVTLWLFWGPRPALADQLFSSVNKASDGNWVISWQCPVGARYQLTGTNGLDAAGECQAIIGVGGNAQSKTIPPATAPLKLTLELTSGGVTQRDTVDIVPAKDSGQEPTLTRLSGGETASGQLQISSPDFGGPFTTIGGYVVAVVKKVIPLIIAGAILVVVFAGFRYITSLGNPDATGQAKSLIEGAVLGIITLFLIGLILASLVDLDLITGSRETPGHSPPTVTDGPGADSGGGGGGIVEGGGEGTGVTPPSKVFKLTSCIKNKNSPSAYDVRFSLALDTQSASRTSNYQFSFPQRTGSVISKINVGGSTATINFKTGLLEILPVAPTAAAINNVFDKTKKLKITNSRIVCTTH